MEYLIPLAIFAALGILAGVLLTVASKVFAVEVDERVDAIAEALPQANCGACGFSGCAGGFAGVAWGLGLPGRCAYVWPGVGVCL